MVDNVSGESMADQRPRFTVSAIGVVYRPDLPDDAPTAQGEYVDPFAESVITVYPEWVAGLTGIEEFSHLVVVLYMDRAAPRHPDDPLTHQVEAAEGMPEVGLFSTRSPRRPNPLGLCCPRLIEHTGDTLRVTGLDAWSGTPVLDIKGYYPRDELRPDAIVPAWLRQLWRQHDAARRPHRTS